jgi:uncharacterized protein (TIGR01777 family)
VEDRGVSSEQSAVRPPERVAISGASGLIGRRLTAWLAGRGYRVQRLVRDRACCGVEDIYWDPRTGEVDAGALRDTAALVHLAGENIAAGRWTAARKAAIRGSRVEGTRGLCERLAALTRRPRTLLAASAIGYYGDRGDEELTEGSPRGAGFLSEVADEWEAATGPARQAGMRVVNLRMGIVLAREGGALAKMAAALRLGVGGRVGRGLQYMSWIAREDLVRACGHLLEAPAACGPVNMVSPEPVRNAEFIHALARVLRRPAWLPLPAPLVRLLLGEMGRELLLASTRLRPQRLLATGFSFRYSKLEDALRAELEPGAPWAGRQINNRRRLPERRR